MAASRCSASDREFLHRRLKTQTAPRFKKDFDLNGGASLHRDNHVLSCASQHGSRHTCSSCNQLLPVRPAAPVYWVSASIGATRASTSSTLLSQANTRRAVSFRHPSMPGVLGLGAAEPRCDWDAGYNTEHAAGLWDDAIPSVPVRRAHQSPPVPDW